MITKSKSFKFILFKNSSNVRSQKYKFRYITCSPRLQAMLVANYIIKSDNITLIYFSDSSTMKYNTVTYFKTLHF